MHRFNSGQLAEPLERQIDIPRLALDSEGPPTGAFRRNQRGAGTYEPIEHEPISVRAVEDCVFHQLDRLYRRMHAESLVAAGAEAVHARISPNIRAVASVPTQFHVVDVFAHTQRFLSSVYTLRPAVNNS